MIAPPAVDDAFSSVIVYFQTERTKIDRRIHPVAEKPEILATSRVSRWISRDVAARVASRATPPRTSSSRASIDLRLRHLDTTMATITMSAAAMAPRTARVSAAKPAAKQFATGGRAVAAKSGVRFHARRSASLIVRAEGEDAAGGAGDAPSMSSDEGDRPRARGASALPVVSVVSVHHRRGFSAALGRGERRFFSVPNHLARLRGAAAARRRPSPAPHDETNRLSMPSRDRRRRVDADGVARRPPGRALRRGVQG